MCVLHHQSSYPRTLVVVDSKSCNWWATSLFITNRHSEMEASLCQPEIRPDPDISGIGMLIAFQIQGTIGLLSSAVLWYLKMHLPQTRRPIVKYLEKQCITFYYSQSVLALSLLITAFSRYKTITLYHLFICTQLIWIVKSGFGILKIGSLFSNSAVSAFHSSMQLLFVVAWMGLDIVTLYRVMKWRIEPGECFIAYNSGGDHDRNDLVFTLSMDLGMITFFTFVLPTLNYFGWERIVNEDWRKPVIYLAGFLQLTFLFGLFFWTNFSIYLIRFTNRQYLTDSESEWGFGQVSAIVTTAFSLTSLAAGYPSRGRRDRAEEATETRV
ncbi:hypothetical protein CPB86DRAFT_106123 [Serendipita vermifera]|nr:hypothetical protein CPB86DRAFT_106123 [Serendipita vermifera]